MTMPDPALPIPLRITHETRYHYAESVTLSFHAAWLTARATATQTVTRTAIAVAPEPRHVDHWIDYYGNHVSFFSIEDSHDELVVSSTGDVTERRGIPHPLDLPLPLKEVTYRMRAWETAEERTALEFLNPSPLVPCTEKLAAYAARSLAADRPYVQGVAHLMTRIHEEFHYDPTVTTVSTPVSEVLSKKHGVCQDFAHVMIACLRSVGAPARYVSGYLVPNPGIVGAQASHAWVSAYCPGIGWIDFDPTNDVMPTTGHVTLAWGRDYSDVSPLKGIVQGGGDHTVQVNVSVERHSGPEPTS